jgi:hypothetical protein
MIKLVYDWRNKVRESELFPHEKTLNHILSPSPCMEQPQNTSDIYTMSNVNNTSYSYLGKHPMTWS